MFPDPIEKFFVEKARRASVPSWWRRVAGADSFEDLAGCLHDFTRVVSIITNHSQHSCMALPFRVASAISDEQTLTPCISCPGYSFGISQVIPDSGAPATAALIPRICLTAVTCALLLACFDTKHIRRSFTLAPAVPSHHGPDSPARLHAMHCRPKSLTCSHVCSASFFSPSLSNLESWGKDAIIVGCHVFAKRIFARLNFSFFPSVVSSPSSLHFFFAGCFVSLSSGQLVVSRRFGVLRDSSHLLNARSLSSSMASYGKDFFF